MTIIFSSVAPRQTNRSFARGINRYTGQYDGTKSYTVSDAAWAAQSFGTRPAEKPDYDRMAGEAAFQSNYENGVPSF